MQNKRQDLEQQIIALQEQKSKLVAEQKAGGTGWTKAKQTKLDEVVTTILDLQDELEALDTPKSDEVSTEYKPKPGTEGFYHVRMTKGKKFDPDTGEQISKPFIQLYTPGEYKHFEKFGTTLGYRNIEVLWDPTKK